MSYRIVGVDAEYNDRSTGLREIMAELYADTASDLPANTASLAFLLGSTATVVDTGTKYAVKSNGVWVAQPSGGGGGGGAILVDKTITANGTYNASDDNADGYRSVVASVPNTYVAGDEGKVVHNGALVAQGSDTVTQNGTVDTTLISSLLVDVASGGITEGVLTPSGAAYTNPIAKVWGTNGFICAVLNDYLYRQSSINLQIGTISGITFPSSQPQTANIYVIGLDVQLGQSYGLPLVSASFNWQSGDITVEISNPSFGNNTNIHAAVVITW